MKDGPRQGGNQSTGKETSRIPSLDEEETWSKATKELDQVPFTWTGILVEVAIIKGRRCRAWTPIVSLTAPPPHLTLGAPSVSRAPSIHLNSVVLLEVQVLKGAVVSAGGTGKKHSILSIQLLRGYQAARDSFEAPTPLRDFDPSGDKRLS